MRGQKSETEEVKSKKVSIGWFLPQQGVGPVSLGTPKEPCRVSPRLSPQGTEAGAFVYHLLRPPPPSLFHPPIGWELPPRALNFPTSGWGGFWENPGMGNREKPKFLRWVPGDIQVLSPQLHGSQMDMRTWQSTVTESQDSSMWDLRVEHMC